MAQQHRCQQWQQHRAGHTGHGYKARTGGQNFCELIQPVHNATYSVIQEARLPYPVVQAWNLSTAWLLANCELGVACLEGEWQVNECCNGVCDPLPITLGPKLRCQYEVSGSMHSGRNQ